MIIYNKIHDYLINKYDSQKIEKIYLICFGIYVFLEAWKTTYIPIPGRIPIRIEWICMLIVAVKIFFIDIKNKRDAFYTLSFFAAFIAITICCDEKLVLYIFCFLFGAKGISFDKIIREYLAISVVVVSLAALLSQCGVIKDAISVVKTSGFVRHSFGIDYVTNFGGHLSFIMMAWAYIAKDKLNYYLIGTGVALEVLQLLYCHTRLDIACIAMILMAHIICTSKCFNTSVKYNKILYYISRVAFPICALLMVIMAYAYSKDNNFLVKIDDLLSHRLILSHRAFMDFFITPFGQVMNYDTSYNKPLWCLDCFYIVYAQISRFLNGRVIHRMPQNRKIR